MGNSAEEKLINANIKLQDENKELKFTLNEQTKLIEQLKTYIKINQDKEGKINAEGILEILGENYE